ncbi:MAG TPA: YbaK/EbsC family protein [Acidimicrobiia bacterium]
MSPARRWEVGHADCRRSAGDGCDSRRQDGRSTKAEQALGAESVRLADEGEFAASFPDIEPGAEPPFEALYDIPTLVDQGLDSPRITFNTGTDAETITMALDDYLELTKPKRADLAH